MIKVKKDMSYLSEIDLLAVEKGVAELGIHSIRLSNILTEEEKEENSRIAKIISSEDWSKRCAERMKVVADKIEKIVDTINENFAIYQYKKNEFEYSSDTWDLFFWCNCGDMSYVTLNPNDSRSNDQQIKDIDNVLSLLQKIEIEGIQVHVQHNVTYKDEKVWNIVKEEYGKVKDKFISYDGITGKIKEVGKTYTGKAVYGFFKKGARSKYYQVPTSWFLQNSFNGEITQ